MLISLNEYGELHGKSGDTLRRMAEKGVLRTAFKIGRNWVVDSEELYPISKRNKKTSASSNPKQLSLLLDDLIIPFAKNNENKFMRYSNESMEKSNGIVYTPSDLAAYVAEQMLDNHAQTKDNYCILDPAIGDGELVLALLNSLMKKNQNSQIIIVGYETDAKIVNKTKRRILDCYPNVQVVIENKDFLEDTVPYRQFLVIFKFVSVGFLPSFSKRRIARLVSGRFSPSKSACRGMSRRVSCLRIRTSRMTPFDI